MSIDAYRSAFPSVAEPPSLPAASAARPQSVPTLSLSGSLSDSRSASWREVRVIATSPLLLDRYLLRRDGARAIDARTLDKYLWMQSAWLMADALRQGIASPVLRLPKRALYIELEHPKQLYQQEVTAFSFAPHETCWVFAVLDGSGQAV